MIRTWLARHFGREVTPGWSNRQRLMVELLADRLTPSTVIYDEVGIIGNSIVGEIQVTTTVTEEDDGDYDWDIFVENLSFEPNPGDGIAMFWLSSPQGTLLGINGGGQYLPPDFYSVPGGASLDPMNGGGIAWGWGPPVGLGQTGAIAPGGSMEFGFQTQPIQVGPPNVLVVNLDTNISVAGQPAPGQVASKVEFASGPDTGNAAGSIDLSVKWSGRPPLPNVTIRVTITETATGRTHLAFIPIATVRGTTPVVNIVSPFVDKPDTVKIEMVDLATGQVYATESKTATTGD